MEEKEIKLLISEDGSHTLFRPDINETYHSTKGALTESIHVFIDAGLNHYVGSQSKKPAAISVFEVGFGTGLNAFLTFLWSEKNKINVNYITLEPFPLKENLYSILNYPLLLNEEEKKFQFLKLHSADPSQRIAIGLYFNFIKQYSKLEDYRSQDGMVDLVFYDAFAPSKQKEVWALENLKKVKGIMNAGGFLVTYCASGQFKRDLKEVGFKLEVLPGPMGKKEMTRAFF